MTQTVTIELDENYKEIADSADHGTVTFQVNHMNPAEIAVDDRTLAQRITAEDEDGITYKHLEGNQISGWSGKIYARCPLKGEVSKITVIRS